MIGKSLRILIEKAMTAVREDDQMSVRDLLLKVEAVNGGKHIIILESEQLVSSHELHP